MSWFNPTNMSPALASQLKMSLSLHAQSNPLEAGQALQAIRSLDFMQLGGNQAFSPLGGQFGALAGGRRRRACVWLAPRGQGAQRETS